MSSVRPNQKHKRKGMPVSMPFSPLTFTSFYQLTCLETPSSASNFSGVHRRRSDLRRHRWNVHHHPRSAHGRRHRHRSVHVHHHRSSAHVHRRNSGRNENRRSWELRGFRRSCRSRRVNMRQTTGYARLAAAYRAADARKESTRIHGPCHLSNRHTHCSRVGPRNPAPCGSSSCLRHRPHYRHARRRN